MRNARVLMIAAMVSALVSVVSAQGKRQGEMFTMPSTSVAETPVAAVLLESPLVRRITEDGRYSPTDINALVDLGGMPVSVLHTSSMGSDAFCCWTVKSFVLVREGDTVKAYPITNASDPDGTFPKMTITAMFGEAGRVGAAGMIGRTRDKVIHKYRFVPPVKPGHYIVEEIK